MPHRLAAVIFCHSSAVESLLATKLKMNQDTLSSELAQLTSRIEALSESTTVEQLCTALNMEDWPGGWDSVESGSGFDVYTWWLDGGCNLHAYFCDGVAVSNRFGPAGISQAGRLIWQWSPNPDDLITMRGAYIMGAARENNRS